VFAGEAGVTESGKCLTVGRKRAAAETVTTKRAGPLSLRATAAGDFQFTDFVD